jgi:crotonobetainyl-CoA:carnitine CoA-transferase CaiB-like acyl-CoA transferase
MKSEIEKSMTLNLQKERGREILLQLVKNADIFVENFRAWLAKQY